MPLVGPLSFEMSDLQISLGPLAMSSGFFLAGCVRWRRRSPDSPLALSNRRMVDCEHKYVPSSRVRLQTWATARSACSSWCNRSKTAWRSVAHSALGGLGRGARARARGSESAGSGWPMLDQGDDTPSWSRPPRPARRGGCRSPSLLLLGVRGSGEHLQERVCFSHDVERRSCLFQLGLEAFVLLAQPVSLFGVRTAHRAGLGAEGGRRSQSPGPSSTR